MYYQCPQQALESYYSGNRVIRLYIADLQSKDIPKEIGNIDTLETLEVHNEALNLILKLFNNRIIVVNEQIIQIPLNPINYLKLRVYL